MVNNRIATELTPDLADKIWRGIEKQMYDQRVSQEIVLHHLKQLKAQMGKAKKDKTKHKYSVDAISLCMEMVDKKIEKILNK